MSANYLPGSCNRYNVYNFVCVFAYYCFEKKNTLIIIKIAIICTIIVVIIDNIIYTYRPIRAHNINFNITIGTAYDNSMHYAPV